MGIPYGRRNAESESAMTKLEQAARLALDAMLIGYSGPHTAHYLKAIEALREALSQQSDKDIILEALMAYQCSEYVDEDGGGTSLVDVLAHGDTIAAGLSEVKALADFIWGAISDSPVQEATK